VKSGKNGIPPEENFSHPKITSGVRICPVKTVDPPEKHPRNHQNHPRNTIESDVPVKEPQFVTMNRTDGSVMERWSNHQDNKSGKSSRVENVPDKSENLTKVSYFSKENVADNISSDAEQDELIWELLICPVIPEDFSEEFIPYPRKKCKRKDSDTDSKFELRQRFSVLRTGVLESPAIAMVSTGKTKVTEVPLSAIELEIMSFVMRFGLKNAPATFCRLVNEVFRGLVGKFVLVYLNDTVVYSESPDQHLNHLQRVLERLQSYGLTCQPKKCTFGVARIKFLGHVVDGEGIDRVPEKLMAIQELPVPKKIKDVLRVLGVCGWYSQFVLHYAEITAPLTGLLANGTKWRWSEIEQEAFRMLKESLVSAPRLCTPLPGRPFNLQTDASEVGVGAVLFQREESGDRKIISYASKKLNPVQGRYSAVKR
jgi:hypothetical protein